MLMKKTILALSLVLLSGCGGGSGNSESPPLPPLTLENLSHTTSQHWLPVTGSFANALATTSSAQLLRIEQNGQIIQPVQGRYALNGALLEVDGLNYRLTPLSNQAISFRYTLQQAGRQGSATLQLAAPLSDPLATEQWHLVNTGQTSYALSDSFRDALIDMLINDPDEPMPPSQASSLVNQLFSDYRNQLRPGFDVDLLPLFAAGIFGQGSISVVVDSGLQLTHEDLAANILAGRSFNLVDGSTDPSPKLDPSWPNAGDHGTSVAGIIAAEGWNGIGGRGIAPNSLLMAINLLADEYAAGLDDEWLVHGLDDSVISADDNISAFNRSYGITLPVMQGYSLLEEELHRFSVEDLRSGKGALNVKSAGNEFEFYGYEGDFCEQNGANELGLSCYNANMESSQQTPYYTIVAAMNPNGHKSSYSSAGANLVLTAPAGEDGDLLPAIVTVDLMSCQHGYSSEAAAAGFDDAIGEGAFAGFYPFDSGSHPDNLACNYTARFNGTSSAAPMVSGVAALLLEAEPTLTARELQHLLISTAKRVHPEDPLIRLNLPDGSFEAHSGWVENAAGIAFNNHYGFGLVQAGAAFQRLQQGNWQLPAKQYSAWHGIALYGDGSPANLAIPDHSAAGVSMALTMPEQLVVETVQLKLTVRNQELLEFGRITEQGSTQTSAGNDLAVVLTSPAGTRSVLLASRQALLLPALDEDWAAQDGYILKDSVFRSNAFYGETSTGNWTLQVYDLAADSFAVQDTEFDFDWIENNAELSRLDGAALRIIGHSKE
ncbi:Proprotein convertase P-domain-containing protein [Alkalimonas amylolytica]|uniref:Proprotein convertase P-domain-containing protein n=2 Tax=Alkalimonas amylolytica TaxID=152573 RepID=A0A1H4CI65_ALKAM|nr:Proprotein convertase P-domain-containing protein [Alkalimonas amylolytica]